jgi:RNA polymerase sigma-70 factor (ECF subfamily)
LHAWLFAIARYQLMMETTRLRRAADYHAKYVPVALARATEMQLQAELDDSARADHLRDCMDELLEHARKLRRERYESGRTFAQIAELLGRSEGAIRKQLWRHLSAWHHFVAPENHTEINVIRADAGRTMSYV